jgi:hypothetical protein
MEELMHNFNKILDEKKEEIIAIASKKERKKRISRSKTILASKPFFWSILPMVYLPLK